MFDRGDHSIALLAQLEQHLLCSRIAIDGDGEIYVASEARLAAGGRRQAADHCKRSADGPKMLRDLSE
jgi:hypothetical protein